MSWEKSNLTFTLWQDLLQAISVSAALTPGSGAAVPLPWLLFKCPQGLCVAASPPSLLLALSHDAKLAQLPALMSVQVRADSSALMLCSQGGVSCLSQAQLELVWVLTQPPEPSSAPFTLGHWTLALHVGGCAWELTAAPATRHLCSSHH